MNIWIVITSYILIYHFKPHVSFFPLTYSHPKGWRLNQIFRVSKLKLRQTHMDVLGFLPTFFFFFEASPLAVLLKQAYLFSNFPA